MQAPSGDVEQVKSEIAKLKSYKTELERKLGFTPGPDAEEEDEEDDEDDTVEVMPEPPKNYNKGPRSSVSAEAYGAWNQKKEFVPPKYEKTPEQRERLQGVLSKSFMFAALEPKDMNIILEAMQEKNFEAGAKIITEGDDG